VLEMRTVDGRRLASALEKPRMWRFWRIELRRGEQDGARAEDGLVWTSLLVGGSGLDDNPHLALRAHRFQNAGRGGWFEVGWYPSPARRQWAPTLRRKRKREHGAIRPWIGINVAPGAREEIRVGVTIGPRDPRWDE
jgi:hypothetical protein